MAVKYLVNFIFSQSLDLLDSFLNIASTDQVVEANEVVRFAVSNFQLLCNITHMLKTTKCK